MTKQSQGTRRATVPSRRDTELLDWFFEQGDSWCLRSSFGSMLERQHLYGYAEDGRRVPKAARHGEHVRTKRTRPEASVTVDEDDLLRAAEASRRLERVRAIDPDAARALRAYHGDIGSRFSHTGAGRIGAVYPLTASGRAWLARQPVASPRDPFERMADEIALQRVAPSAERAMLLATIHGEAEALIGKAWRFWAATSVPAGRVG